MANGIDETRKSSGGRISMELTKRGGLLTEWFSLNVHEPENRKGCDNLNLPYKRKLTSSE